MPRWTPRPAPRLKEFNVVRCSHCKFVQAVRKKAACKSCGKPLDASRLRILASTNKVTEVPALVQRIKASQAYE